MEEVGAAAGDCRFPIPTAVTRARALVALTMIAGVVASAATGTAAAGVALDLRAPFAFGLRVTDSATPTVQIVGVSPATIGGDTSRITYHASESGQARARLGNCAGRQLAAAAYTATGNATLLVHAADLGQRANTVAVCVRGGAGNTGSAAVTVPSTVQLSRPNIVVIETDDQTVESVRVMANVNRLLVANGTTFDNNVVSYALCCPSRATFLTGQYAHNHGVQSNHAPDGGYYKLDHTNTLAVWLQQAGYYTVLDGKYLNQYGDINPYEIPPGWNEWYATVGGSSLVYYNYRVNANGRLVSYGSDPASYVTDVEARRAVDIIRQRAPLAQPFFLWFAPFAPHRDWFSATSIPAPRHLNSFASERLPMPPSFNEGDVSDKPARIRSLPLLGTSAIASITTRYRRYLETLLAVDEAVQSVVDALAATAELGNTVIIFTSDNGMMFGEHRLSYGKIIVYEPSSRVPLIIRGPGFPAGRHVSTPVANIDLAPTIVQAAGAVPGRGMDGRSLLPIAQNPALAADRAILLEAKLGGYSAIRTSQYLYVEYTTGERELYDLLNDPDELTSQHANPAFGSIRLGLASKLRVLKTCNGITCGAQ